MIKIKNIAIITSVLLIGLMSVNTVSFATETEIQPRTMIMSEEEVTEIQPRVMTISEEETTEVQPRSQEEELLDDFVVTTEGTVVTDEAALHNLKKPTFFKQYGIDILALVISLGVLAYVTYDVNKDKLKKIEKESEVKVEGKLDSNMEK